MSGGPQGSMKGGGQVRGGKAQYPEGLPSSRKIWTVTMQKALMQALAQKHGVYRCTCPMCSRWTNVP